MSYEGIPKPQRPLEWLLTEIERRAGPVVDYDFTDMERNGDPGDRGTIYAAVLTDPMTIGAAICLFYETPNEIDGEEETYLMVRVLTEEDAPAAVDCPTRILDRLTSTEHEDALEWRDACRDTAAVEWTPRSVEHRIH